jgi:hypothetical protein
MYANPKPKIWKRQIFFVTEVIIMVTFGVASGHEVSQGISCQYSFFKKNVNSD